LRAALYHFGTRIHQQEKSMPPLQLSDPPFSNLGRPASKVIDKLSQGYSNFYAGEAWTPNVNLYETDDAYVVCVDLAGVLKEKIDVEVVDNQLNLKGHRPVPTDFDPQCVEGKGKCKVHLMEIDHGGFSRQVELPQDVAKEKITATYRNGLLWIELPKK
jgi:HSP20 family protein